MPQVRVKICYVLQVPTFELHVAADAHSKLLPPLLALDLLALRLHRGTLRTVRAGMESRGAAGVPLEVWEMVRSELVELELKASKEAVMAKFRGEDCARTRRRRKQWTEWKYPFCEECTEIVLDGFRWASYTAVDDLLSSYGLEVSGEVKLDKEEWVDFSACTLSALALPVLPPSLTPSTSAPSTELEISHDPGAVFQRTDVALLSSSFPPNPSHDRRFKALLTNYHLRPNTRQLHSFLPLPTTSPLSPPKIPSASSDEANGGSSGGKSGGARSANEPWWMLWLSCEGK